MNNRQRLKIVFFSHSSRLEGAERSLLEIIEYLYLSDKVSPLVILPRKGKFEAALMRKKIPYIITTRMAWWVDSTRLRNILLGPFKWYWNYFSWFLIKKKVKKFNPDIAYINTLVTPYGSIAAKSLKIPMVWHIHEFIPQGLNKNYDFGKKWSLGKVTKSDAIIVNSYATYKDISQYVLPNRVHVIYNGTDLNLFRLNQHKELINDDTVRLLMVGNIDENKDQETALRCISYLNGLIKIKAVLTIVGEGNKQYYKKLQNIATSLGIQNQIVWKGWQNVTVPFFEAAHITLSCSKKEGFGRTIIESMACGTPVICTNSGGAPEIVRQIDSELVVDHGDYRSIAEKIIRLIQNKSLYTEISLKGRKVVENNFDMNNSINKIYNILTSIKSNK